MLFNNARCRTLTPGYVNGAAGLDLHQFRWLDDGEIGESPPRVGTISWTSLPYDANAALAHYTLGRAVLRGDARLRIRRRVARRSTPS